jgi:hypothetical protein
MFPSEKIQGEIVNQFERAADENGQIFRIPRAQSMALRPSSVVFLTSETNPQIESQGHCALRITRDRTSDLYVKIGRSILKSIFNGKQGWFELLEHLPGEMEVVTGERLVEKSKLYSKNDLSDYISDQPEYAAVTKFFLQKAAEKLNSLASKQIESFFNSLVVNGSQIQIFSGATGLGKTKTVQSIAGVLGLKVHEFSPHEPTTARSCFLYFNCEKFLIDPNFSSYLEQFIAFSEAENVLSVIECRDIDVLHPNLQKKFPVVKFRGFSNQQKREVVEQRIVDIDPDKLALGLKVTRSEPGVNGLLQFLTTNTGFKDQQSIDARLRLPQGIQVIGVNIQNGYIHTLQATYTPGPVDRLTVSGGMEDSFKSSVDCAFQFLKSRLQFTGSVHVHICGGLGKKGGVSAGAGAALAMYLAVEKGLPRSDTAILGEITLFGEILPVGGIPEKILAASRYGIKRLFLPLGNRYEVPESTDCQLIYIDNFTQIESDYFKV